MADPETQSPTEDQQKAPLKEKEVIGKFWFVYFFNTLTCDFRGWNGRRGVIEILITRKASKLVLKIVIVTRFMYFAISVLRTDLYLYYVD